MMAPLLLRFAGQDGIESENRANAVRTSGGFFPGVRVIMDFCRGGQQCWNVILSTRNRLFSLRHFGILSENHVFRHLLTELTCFLRSYWNKLCQWSIY